MTVCNCDTQNIALNTNIYTSGFSETQYPPAEDFTSTHPVEPSGYPPALNPTAPPYASGIYIIYNRILVTLNSIITIIFGLRHGRGLL